MQHRQCGWFFVQMERVGLKGQRGVECHPQADVIVRADKLERVFDRFYRGDNSPMTPGFGLGLPIAKTLVDGMGGTIAVESEVSQGSTVFVCFPALNK